MSWNVWSILNEEKLENFLQILEDNCINIACITESWFDAENGVFSQKIKSRGYKLHHAYRESQRGGGVAVMFKKQITVKPGDASSSEYSSFEYAYIIITLNAKRRLVLLCIYRNQEININYTSRNIMSTYCSCKWNTPHLFTLKTKKKGHEVKILVDEGADYTLLSDSKIDKVQEPATYHGSVKLEISEVAGCSKTSAAKVFSVTLHTMKKK